MPTDDSPSPSPSPSRTSLLLGFRPPTTPDGPPSSSLPSPSPSPENLPSPEDLAPDSGDDWDAATYPESPDDTTSQGSTPASDADAKKVELLDEETLQQFARGGIAAAGLKVHETFATTAGQKHVGLYLTDEKDQAQIGDPLASIAARHQGVGKVNPDVKDLMAAMVGLVGYGVKQINKRTEARGLDAGAGNPQPMPAAVDL